MRPGSRASRGSVARWAVTPSLAFLTMLVSACDRRRRSKRAIIGSAGSSSSRAISGWPTRIRKVTCPTHLPRSSSASMAFGMRAKDENSSTIRFMSSTCRMIVSVHWSKTSRPSVMTLL